MSALKQCPFALGTLDDISGRIGYSVLRNAGIKPRIVATSENMGTLLGMATEGLGAVFCPTDVLASSEKSSQLVRISLPNQTTYTISLGIPVKAEPWNALEVLKEALNYVADCRHTQINK